MNKNEFASLPIEVSTLAKRIVNEEDITQVQLDYIIESNQIDEDQLYDAVSHMNDQFNKNILFSSIVLVLLILSFSSMMIFLISSNL
jgi:hypothetical protein